MGKNKNKQVYLTQGDRMMIGLLANLSSAKRGFATDDEVKNAEQMIHNILAALSGKAYRVARCIVDPSFQDTPKVAKAAAGFIEWAESTPYESKADFQS